MSAILRVVSIIWLLFCGSLAVFGIYQSHFANPAGGIAPALMLTFLTVPLGTLVPLAYAGISKNLSTSNISLSLAGDFFVYVSMIGMGYWQWFILLPKVVRGVQKKQSPKVWGLVLIGAIAVLYGVYRFYIHVFPGAHLN